MKTKLAISILIIFLLSSIYAFGWFFAIPKSAQVMIPIKWRAVKLGQKRTDYLYYLGDPSSDSLQWKTSGDTWIIRNGNYTYELSLKYDNNSLGSSRIMKYHFQNWLFDKSEVIVEDGVERNKI